MSFVYSSSQFIKLYTAYTDVLNSNIKNYINGSCHFTSMHVIAPALSPSPMVHSTRASFFSIVCRVFLDDSHLTGSLPTTMGLDLYSYGFGSHLHPKFLPDPLGQLVEPGVSRSEQLN